MGLAFRHVGIVVSDFDLALEIFTNYLDCEIVNIYPDVKGDYISTLVGIQNVSMKVGILKTQDDNRIELLQYISHPGVKRKPVLSNNVGVSHFAVTVKDIQDLYNKRSEFKVEFLSAPLKSPNGYVEVAYAILMEECMVELVQVFDERAKYSI